MCTSKQRVAGPVGDLCETFSKYAVQKNRKSQPIRVWLAHGG